MSSPYQASSSHRRTVYFSGSVQGVGLRYTARNLAMSYNVSGFIRNLSDGRVELVLEGPDGDVDQLVDNVRQKMACYIRQVDSQTGPATGEFAQFCIRH